MAMLKTFAFLTLTAAATFAGAGVAQAQFALRQAPLTHISPIRMPGLHKVDNVTMKRGVMSMQKGLHAPKTPGASSKPKEIVVVGSKVKGANNHPDFAWLPTGNPTGPQ